MLPLRAQTAGKWPSSTYGGGEKLFCDEKTILEIRDRIDRYDWAAEAYRDLVYRVRHPFPASPMTEGLKMDVMRLKEAALLYRIDGDETMLPTLVRALS